MDWLANAKGAIPRKKYEQKLSNGWAQTNAVFFWAKNLAVLAAAGLVAAVMITAFFR